MTQESIIRLLTDQETMLEKRRTTALARGMWTKVIEVEAVLDYSRALRARIAEIAEFEKAKTANGGTSNP